MHGRAAVPDFIEGEHVHKTEIVDNTGEAIVNLKVTCPHGRVSGSHARFSRSGKHSNCEKNRSLCARNVNRFGPAQVQAFLGAWLEKMNEYDNGQAHVNYNPTLAEVTEYIRRHDLNP